MSLAPRSPKSAQISFNTEDQTAENIFAVISAILGRGECLGCGRVALLAVEFAVDPGPELRENGVTSVTLTGM